MASAEIRRERKMRTKFFCTNFLNTTRGPGHPGKIPGTSRIPLFETQGRQSFEGGHEVFGHHPFAWKTPTPPGGLRTQKLNLCALFSCLNPRGIYPNKFLGEFCGFFFGGFVGPFSLEKEEENSPQPPNLCRYACRFGDGHPSTPKSNTGLRKSSFAKP